MTRDTLPGRGDDSESRSWQFKCALSQTSPCRGQLSLSSLAATCWSELRVVCRDSNLLMLLYANQCAWNGISMLCTIHIRTKMCCCSLLNE
eukprot:757323-Hanusia_phi.AAC.1